MFNPIPEPILARMRQLEAQDAGERRDGTPRLKRLRQIPPETGKFLAILAASAPAGNIIEIGTSAGYSTLWLALACLANGRTLTTFEILPEKVKRATETFTQTGVSDVVTLVYGDARQHLAGIADVAFCFLDAEKEVYGDCYDLVVPNLTTGGLLVADNAISHGDAMRDVLDQALQDPRLDALIVPIGKGLLLGRRTVN